MGRGGAVCLCGGKERRRRRGKEEKKANSIQAYFTAQCFCFAYGDGADQSQFTSLTSLDTVAGQNAFALTFWTANFLNSGESGALNVVTSDIFATAVEHFANNDLDPPDYLIGEEIVVPPRKYIRNMIQPSDDLVSADCYWNGIKDLDIYQAAGVGNHFFYLLAEGTTNGSPSLLCGPNDKMIATFPGTILGIGIEKASAIWYRALTTYFTPDTTYEYAYLTTVRSASELYGTNSIESNAVFSAWVAVGVAETV